MFCLRPHLSLWFFVMAFIVRSISEAVVDWLCVARLHVAARLSLEVEKKPCCDMLWPKWERGILNLEPTMSEMNAMANILVMIRGQ